ncbi:mannitol-1-phosphate 5-dehydrogenase [Oceanobacillus timonensis]|uniref:mannitol-1-phosphate 5-dehydrogenase n=1 Tax=Oceanobacillus timonensis TaxID=1926285 RepID=UPI0009BAAC38|nr:mannitol-1-phosphate 5-dehydrogenase [Oceanobacillus timonensis]
MNNAVHFGAGVIGRGFIGDLLHATGYQVTFVEVSKQLVKQINETNSYDLYLIDNNYEKKVIDYVQAISPVEDEQCVIDMIVNGTIVTTSVWADNLPKIAHILAKGLKQRMAKTDQKINVIACENALFATDMLKREILNCGVDITEQELNRIASFPNAAVDRMVFGKLVDGKRAVDIGKNYELVIERDKLANPNSEPIKGAIYTDNLHKFLERKLYITNCSHAYAAYMGYLKGYDNVQDALADKTIYQQVLAAVHESADMLLAKYNFGKKDLEDYIQFVLGRFMTEGIQDPITRVARSPIRKLDSTDRLVAPALQCEKFGMENTYLCRGIAAALLFKNPEDSQAVEMNDYINDNGIEQAVLHYTKIDKNSKTYTNVLSHFHNLIQNK